MSKQFGLVPQEDFEWIAEQDPCVQQLWIECWRAEKFGDRFNSLETELSEKSFRKAKQVLEGVMFEFDAVTNLMASGRAAITGWKVRNLHGSRLKQKKFQPTTEYQNFLQSDYWEIVRDRILYRDNHTCQQCGSQTRLQVHHLTYEHHGEEHLYPEDLITLCRSCHEEVHGLSHQ